MKKLVFFLIVIIVFTTSCTREYICQCTVSYSGNQPGLPDSSLYEYNVKDTHKGAKKVCEKYSTSTTQDNITMTENCKLY